MRLAVVSLMIAGAAVLLDTRGSVAQSPYQYQWCAVYAGKSEGRSEACYYKSFAECMASVSGVGGYCIQSQYYTGQADTPQRCKMKTQDSSALTAGLC